MTLYATTTNRFSGAGTLAHASLAALTRWTRVFVSHWRKQTSIRATGLLLDCMNDSALDELGMSRVGRGVPWLDCREAFPCGDFEYRPLGEARRGGAD